MVYVSAFQQYYVFHMLANWILICIFSFKQTHWKIILVFRKSCLQLLTCFEEVEERFTYFTTKEHSCRKEFVDVHKVTFLGGVFTITSRWSLFLKKNSDYFQSLPLGGMLKFQANKEINNVGQRCRHFVFFIPDSPFKVRDQSTRPNSKQNSSSSMTRTKKQ